MHVRVLAFARLRELLGFGSRELDLDAGSSLDDLWQRLARDSVGLQDMRASTRFARNGALVGAGTTLCEGDEIALLPPVGGG